MIDWDSAVLAPCFDVFSEPAQYTPAVGAAFTCNVVFDAGYIGVEIAGLTAMSTAPRVGIRLAEFPSGFDPENAQGDTLIITRTGQSFVVKDGRKDSHGHARLDLNKA